MDKLERIRWMAVLVTVLCVAAIVWVLVDRTAYTSAIVVLGAAGVLAYIGKQGW